MNVLNNFYSKKLFGICDSAWNIKSLPSENIIYLWFDFIRMRDILTNCDYQIDKETGIATFKWNPSQKSFYDIKDVISSLNSINDIAELAIIETDSFIHKHSFDCGEFLDSEAIIIFEKNLSIKKSIKKYLSLIAAYEESRMKSTDISAANSAEDESLSFKDVASEILSKSLERYSKKIVSLSKSTAKNIAQQIRNVILAPPKNRFGFNSKNYAYSWIIGKAFDGLETNISLSSIYDIMIASAFLSTPRNFNPYALLLEDYESNEEEEIQKHNKKCFQELDDLNRFCGHFSLRKITIELFDSDGSFTNLSKYFMERFSLANYINLLFKIVKDSSIQDKTIHCFRSLSICPLVDFRLDLLKYILENKIDNKRIHFLTDAARFYTFYYLPLLQYIFKVFLTIYYSTKKMFPVNDDISYPMFDLFSIDKEKKIENFLTPIFPNEFVGSMNYNSIIKFIYQSFYESLSLPNHCSFFDLMLNFSAQKNEFDDYRYNGRYYGKSFPYQRFDYYVATFFENNINMINSIDEFVAYTNSDKYFIARAVNG